MATFDYSYLESVWPTVAAGVENQSMRSTPLLARFKANAKKSGASTLYYPISYGYADNQIRYSSRGTPTEIIPMDNMGNLSFTPSLLTGSMPIYKEDELLLVDNPGQVVDFIKTWTEILVDSIDTRISMRLHDQGTTSTAPVEMSSLKDAVGSTTNTFGGRSRSTYTYWQPKVVTGTTDFPGCNDPAQLEDPTKDAYIIKILQAMYAKCSRLKAKPCTDILVGQWHYDLMERLLDPQKRGDIKDGGMAQIGFDAIKFRKAIIYVDDAMVDAQIDSNSERYSDGTDIDEDFNTITASSAADIAALNLTGRMLFLNLAGDFLRMWLHPAANWSWGPFVDLANVPGAKVKHLFVQAQIVSNCSAVHATLNSIYSPVKYAR